MSALNDGYCSDDGSSGSLLCHRYILATLLSSPVRMSEISTVGCSEVRWAVGIAANGDSELLGVWGPRVVGLRPATGALAEAGNPARPVAPPPAWHAHFADMRARGLARVRLVVCPDSPSFASELRDCFPGATALPSFALQFEVSVSRAAQDHRASMALLLQDIIDAGSPHEAGQALDHLESSRLGQRYPDVVAAWRLTLEQGRPLFDAAPSLRRVVHSGDGLSVDMNRSLGRAIARRRPFTSADDAVEFVRAALERRLRAIGGSDKGAVTARSRTRTALATTMSASL